MPENSRATYTLSSWPAKCGNLPSFVSRRLLKPMDKRISYESWLEVFLAEVIGTAWLMFFGCMGLFASATQVLPLPPLQGAVVFGFIVSSIIVAVGHISKAHLNPAVTICFLILDTITPLTAVIYIFAECIGGLLGMYLLKLTMPHTLYSDYNSNTTCGFCSTCMCPGLEVWQALLLEFLATSILCWVVCSVMDPRNEKNTDSTSIKFALIITCLSVTVGPFTGASMNPARSLAPAVVNRKWCDDHWVYWCGPILGSVVTTYLYKCVFLTKLSPSDLSSPVDHKSIDSRHDQITQKQSSMSINDSNPSKKHTANLA